MLCADLAVDHAAFDLFDASVFARGVDILDDVDINAGTCGLRADCTLRYPLNNGYRSVWRGMFTSPDPLHMQTQSRYIGAQAYTYAANRPQVNQDSDGRSPQDVDSLVRFGQTQIDDMTANGIRHPNFIWNNLSAFIHHAVQSKTAKSRPYKQCQEQTSKIFDDFARYIDQEDNELDDIWIPSLRTSHAFSSGTPFGHAWLVLRSMNESDPDVLIDSLFNEVKICPKNYKDPDQCSPY